MNVEAQTKIFVVILLSTGSENKFTALLGCIDDADKTSGCSVCKHSLDGRIEMHSREKFKSFNGSHSVQMKQQ